MPRRFRRAFQRHAVPVSLTVAATLHQARTCLADSSPELVIAELSLPDGKGSDILSGGDQAARFPLVLLAERDSERAAVKAIGAGAAGLRHQVGGLAGRPAPHCASCSGRLGTRDAPGACRNVIEGKRTAVPRNL